LQPFSNSSSSSFDIVIVLAPLRKHEPYQPYTEDLTLSDAVLDEVREWRNRALDRMYPIVIFDALRVKIRDADSRMVKNKAVYIALGVTREGEREVLGLWIADNEGAKFWLSVMNELRNRGVQDILIAVVDGLKGFPDAITAAFPETTVQTCIVHLIRHSMNFCSWKDRKTVAADLRPIYEAPTAEEAARQLDSFEGKWGDKYPSIAPAWRRASSTTPTIDWLITAVGPPPWATRTLMSDM
jgi:transposase-like protein